MISRQSFIVVAACALLFAVLACNLPANTPPSPGGDAASITPQPPPLPTNTKTMTETALPTQNPDLSLTIDATATATVTFTSTFTSTATLTSTPTRTPTKTPTRTPTNTPLPPLPDFNGVLSFGGGGGCGRCGVGYCYASTNFTFSKAVFGISINEWGDPSERKGFLCLYGITQGLPFSVSLISPDKKTILRSDFVYQTGGLYWDGKFFPVDDIGNQDDNGLIYAELPILWPIGVPTGTWQVYSDGAGFQAQGNFDATRVIGDEVNRIQEVGVFDPLLQYKILPASHRFVPKMDTGGLSVVGTGFAQNSLVYILTYRETNKRSGPNNYNIVWDLINKKSVVSDSRGFISTEITGPFYTKQLYMVVSVSKPTRLLNNTDGWSFNFNDDSIGYQQFEVMEATSSQTTNSCPGAPPQRMVVSQRGYVCTKGDNVRIRNAPKRSGTTIDSLPVGTQFTVLNGPSCADNWSWWQIRTDYGVTGWIAEGGDEIDPYFVCPLP